MSEKNNKENQEAVRHQSAHFVSHRREEVMSVM